MGHEHTSVDLRVLVHVSGDPPTLATPWGDWEFDSREEMDAELQNVFDDVGPREWWWWIGPVSLRRS